MNRTTEERPTTRPAIRPHRAAARTGGRLGNWELREAVGSGTLCDVYRARRLREDGDVPANYVLKLLRSQWEAEPAAVRCMQREALVGRSVRHMHLIPVLSAYVDQPPYFLILPWLEGTTLNEHLRRAQRPPLPVCLSWARQTAEALTALHSAQRVHGDVKPENIFVSPTGHVTLFDFGFAYEQAELRQPHQRPVFGTAQYLAPELTSELMLTTTASDIYSLGVVLFETLSGRRPFTARELHELARQHRSETPPKLRSLVPHLPREVAALVHRMLHKEPLRRPTATEVVHDLVDLELAHFADRQPWLTLLG